MTQRWIKSVWALTYVRLKGLITSHLSASQGGEYIPLFLSIWKTKGMLKSCNNEVWQNLTQQFNKHEQMGFL